MKLMSAALAVPVPPVGALELPVEPPAEYTLTRDHVVAASTHFYVPDKLPAGTVMRHESGYSECFYTWDGFVRYRDFLVSWKEIRRTERGLEHPAKETDAPAHEGYELRGKIGFRKGAA